MWRLDCPPGGRWRSAGWALPLLVLIGCSPVDESADPPVAAIPADDEVWEILFDGQTFDGWRGFGRSDVPEGWVITEEGDIHFTSADGDINLGLITEERFSDFDLRFEWRIAPGGNSGVFFRVRENDHEAIWHTGPEYQVVDNTGHPDGENPLTSAGSNYALHGPEEDYMRPVGEYNEGRVLVTGDRVQHWLNGHKVVEYELWDDGWEERVAGTAFARFPEYGRSRSGHIALQEGGPVWYRNIRILRLN
jgi:hypothetical protein